MTDTDSTTTPADTATSDAELLAIWDRLPTDERNMLRRMCEMHHDDLWVHTPEERRVADSLNRRGLANYILPYAWAIALGRSVYEAHQREVAGE